MLGNLVTGVFAAFLGLTSSPGVGCHLLGQELQDCLAYPDVLVSVLVTFLLLSDLDRLVGSSGQVWLPG